MISQVKNYIRHLGSIIICSIIACLVQLAAVGIALGPIINKSDDTPRTDAAFTGFERLCGWLSEGMAYPMTWIAPHFLTGTGTLILTLIFCYGSWEIVLYLLFQSFLRLVQRLRNAN